MKLLLGKKIGMSRIFDENGKVTPITLIKVGKLTVSSTRSENEKTRVFARTKKDLSEIKEKLRPTEMIEKSFLSDNSEYKKGDLLTLKDFEDSKTVDIKAVSKGKGFAGTIKRHHFHRGPVSHGSHNVRQPGSIGAMFPQRVVKGRKMPGHLGNETVTIKSLKIVEIDVSKEIIVLKGSVPGSRNTVVEIRG
ncbi:MAG: 50S ribosomal protein L3 [Patescibacteria group bacterium]|jgi:large subunit ribosomal protein L3